MYRFHYFVKRAVDRGKFHCIRLPAGHVQIPELIETYKPIGWNVFIAYTYKPAEKEEIFQLQQRFQAFQWNDVFEIEDLSESKKSPLA